MSTPPLTFTVRNGPFGAVRPQPGWPGRFGAFQGQMENEWVPLLRPGFHPLGNAIALWYSLESDPLTKFDAWRRLLWVAFKR
jgi:hypothetical protein